MRTLAIETAKQGITVNAICPGPVRTRMNNLRVEYEAKRLGKSVAEFEADLTPIGRRLEPTRDCAARRVSRQPRSVRRHGTGIQH